MAGSSGSGNSSTQPNQSTPSNQTPAPNASTPGGVGRGSPNSLVITPSPGVWQYPSGSSGGGGGGGGSGGGGYPAPTPTLQRIDIPQIKGFTQSEVAQAYFNQLSANRPPGSTVALRDGYIEVSGFTPSQNYQTTVTEALSRQSLQNAPERNPVQSVQPQLQSLQGVNQVGLSLPYAGGVEFGVPQGYVGTLTPKGIALNPLMNRQYTEVTNPSLNVAPQQQLNQQLPTDINARPNPNPYPEGFNQEQVNAAFRPSLRSAETLDPRLNMRVTSQNFKPTIVNKGGVFSEGTGYTLTPGSVGDTYALLAAPYMVGRNSYANESSVNPALTQNVVALGLAAGLTLYQGTIGLPETAVKTVENPSSIATSAISLVKNLGTTEGRPAAVGSILGMIGAGKVASPIVKGITSEITAKFVKPQVKYTTTLTTGYDIQELAMKEGDAIYGRTTTTPRTITVTTSTPPELSLVDTINGKFTRRIFSTNPSSASGYAAIEEITQTGEARLTNPATGGAVAELSVKPGSSGISFAYKSSMSDLAGALAERSYKTTANIFGKTNPTEGMVAEPNLPSPKSDVLFLRPKSSLNIFGEAIEETPAERAAASATLQRAKLGIAEANERAEAASGTNNAEAPITASRQQTQNTVMDLSSETGTPTVRIKATPLQSEVDLLNTQKNQAINRLGGITAEETQRVGNQGLEVTFTENARYSNRITSGNEGTALISNDNLGTRVSILKTMPKGTVTSSLARTTTSLTFDLDLKSTQLAKVLSNEAKGTPRSPLTSASLLEQKAIPETPAQQALAHEAYLRGKAGMAEAIDRANLAEQTRIPETPAERAAWHEAYVRGKAGMAEAEERAGLVERTNAQANGMVSKIAQKAVTATKPTAPALTEAELARAIESGTPLPKQLTTVKSFNIENYNGANAVPISSSIILSEVAASRYALSSSDRMPTQTQGREAQQVGAITNLQRSTPLTSFEQGATILQGQRSSFEQARTPLQAQRNSTTSATSQARAQDFRSQMAQAVATEVTNVQAQTPISAQMQSQAQSQTQTTRPAPTIPNPRIPNELSPKPPSDDDSKKRKAAVNPSKAKAVKQTKQTLYYRPNAVLSERVGIATGRAVSPISQTYAAKQVSRSPFAVLRPSELQKGIVRFKLR